jgi:hypothetical protein
LAHRIVIEDIDVDADPSNDEFSGAATDADNHPGALAITAGGAGWQRTLQRK